MFSRIKGFFIDFYTVPVSELTGLRRSIYKIGKILFISLRSFVEDRCILRASALTFYSLMSIVPVVAMSLAVAKGFGYQGHWEESLLTRFKEQEEILTQIIAFAKNLLNNSRSGIVTVVGILLLFWSVVKVLSHIESAMNYIWQVVKQRNWRRKFSDYFVMMLIGPIGFIAASSVTVFIVGKLKGYIENLSIHETISSSLLFLIQLSPYALIWVLFTFIYLFMPNTKVKILPSLAGGIIAGTVYQILQWGYLYFQIGLSRYSAIYGSFAALPLFLIWLQLSWLIVLSGAEITCSIQNFDIYEFGKKDLPISHNLKTLLSLWVSYLCVQRFVNKEKPLSLKDLHKKLNVPMILIDQIVRDLVICGVLSKIRVFKKEKVYYQPAQPTEDLRVKDVIDLLDKQGLNEIAKIKSKELEKVMEILLSFSKAVDQSSSNKLIKDL